MAHTPKAEETQHVIVDIPASEEVPLEKDDSISEVVSVEGNHEELTTVHDEEEGRLHNFRKKLDEVPGEPFEVRPVTIFRLPAWFHETCKELCEPKIASIGPYHHGKESLQGMEEHKWSCLRDFLARNKKVGLEVYFEKMRALETQARQCYSETVNLESDDFVMMLLLDGCFILEWFLRVQKREREPDVICDAGWAEKFYGDMFLLENQIPFLVIKELFDINRGEAHKCEGNCPLQELFSLDLNVISFTQFSPPQTPCHNIHHLLHLYYKTIVPDVPSPKQMTDIVPSTVQRNLASGKLCSWMPRLFHRPEFISKPSNVAPERMVTHYIPCASELHEAGVKFKKKTCPRHICDISFTNGIMEIPTLEMDDNYKVSLWNMVAFEQSQRFIIRQTLSSYLALMDLLINTEKDVAILERCGIINSILQNDEDAAAFFNQFGNCFVLNYEKHYFHGLFQVIKAYSNSTWHKYRAKLMHDYFSNPWSSISVMAAGSLLILAVMQTYYSAK